MDVGADTEIRGKPEAFDYESVAMEMYLTFAAG